MGRPATAAWCLALALGLALPGASAAGLPFNATLEVGDTCGDPNHDRRVSVSDAIAILSAALDLGDCDICECDLDDSGLVEIEDAFVALQVSVSLAAARLCPSCDVDVCDPSVCAPAVNYCSTLLPGIPGLPPFRECVALPEACSAAEGDGCDCVMEQSGFEYGCYCEQAGGGIVNVVCAAP